VTFPALARSDRLRSSRRWRAIAGNLILALLATGFLVEYLTHVAMEIPHEKRHHLVTAAELAPEVRDVTTTTSDGLTVAAWWWPVAHEEGAPVILVHGLGGSRADMWRGLKLVHGLGRSTLAIDLRGHGESAPGLPTSFGWRERLDVEAWITWLQVKQGPETRPVLWGTSLGAVTCLLAAAEDTRIGGVIADAPFDTFRHTLIRHAALYYHLGDSLLVPLVAWRIGAEDHVPVDDLDCVKAAARIHVPVLFIAGELDQRMPPADVRRIYDAANPPKSWFVVPQAGHSRRPFHPDFCAAVTTYLQQSAFPSPASSTSALPKPTNLR
jgi:pimeloyl-ACP methyl ester carboxylesterase